MFRLHWILPIRKLSRLVFPYTTVAKGKPIVNSADAAGRIEYIDLAAANDAIVIALCNGEGIAKDNDERMMYCQTLLERGMEHGMEADRSVVRSAVPGCKGYAGQADGSSGVLSRCSLIWV